MRPEQNVVGIAGAVVGLSGVQIVSANLAEENLALHAKATRGGGRAARGNQPRDHLELRTQIRIEGRASLGWSDLRRKRRGPIISGCVLNRIVQQAAGVDGLCSYRGVGL